MELAGHSHITDYFMMIADFLPTFSFKSTANDFALSVSFLPLLDVISSVNLPLARGHFIPLSTAVPGLILLTGNNSEGNEASQAHWFIIRLSEAVDLGSAVSPSRSRTLGKIMPERTRPTDPEL